ncbi:DNA-directed RNA polymerases I, II, and III subunit RPABC3 [Grifola frondosa]|uniref:DNA-directed RNA polymerases I, II, and III subunit RPABC3 n=1 Tax=Grifola frondosa TaxID=5627 RepID=A0A1C7MQ09_GRIFR|nr:DNA-directed RNA polymerases I, II, and III subunit RPABC3 [Grifola frondosa]
MADPAGARSSVGAILVGSLVATFLSGIVTMQTLFYFRLYPDDTLRFKAIALVVWSLDILHTIMAIAANWDGLIMKWGDESAFDYIPWMIGATVVITAIVTFIVQCFFAYRVFTVSRRNVFITIPIAVLAFLRLVAASASTYEMIRLESYAAFVRLYGWVFTLGLSLSSALDVLVTASLCYFLKRSRTGLSSMDYIVNALTLYTIENGMLTCITTIITLICWIAMPHNLVFLAFHLTITKLYANSLLATLNARRSLRITKLSRQTMGSMPVMFTHGTFDSDRYLPRTEDVAMSPALQVNVTKSIHTDFDYVLFLNMIMNAIFLANYSSRMSPLTVLHELPFKDSAMTTTSSNIVFDDIFTINAIDKEGKNSTEVCLSTSVLDSFVSRLYAHSKNYDMDLTLDYNIELFPLQKDQSFALALASSLARGPQAAGGTTEEEEKDRDVWRPDGKGRRGLEEDYDYVMYGKVYRFDGGAAEIVTAYASFGGLLMSLTGSFRHMTSVVLGDPVYILLRK